MSSRYVPLHWWKKVGAQGQEGPPLATAYLRFERFVDKLNTTRYIIVRL